MVITVIKNGNDSETLTMEVSEANFRRISMQKCEVQNIIKACELFELIIFIAILSFRH